MTIPFEAWPWPWLKTLRQQFQHLFCLCTVCPFLGMVWSMCVCVHGKSVDMNAHQAFWCAHACPGLRLLWRVCVYCEHAGTTISHVNKHEWNLLSSTFGWRCDRIYFHRYFLRALEPFQSNLHMCASVCFKRASISQPWSWFWAAEATCPQTHKRSDATII